MLLHNRKLKLLFDLFKSLIRVFHLSVQMKSNIFYYFGSLYFNLKRLSFKMAANKWEITITVTSSIVLWWIFNLLNLSGDRIIIQLSLIIHLKLTTIIVLWKTYIDTLITSMFENKYVHVCMYYQQVIMHTYYSCLNKNKKLFIHYCYSIRSLSDIFYLAVFFISWVS